MSISFYDIIWLEKGVRSMQNFFGREQQLEKLDALWRKDSSSSVVVAGDGFFDYLVPADRLLGR